MLALAVAATMAAKPVVVMIHGAGGGGWEWEKWRPVFARAGWRVVAHDLQPASGGLAKTTLADYERQVVSWCPKGQPVVLVGASMGGMLALRVAERVRARAVVLVNSVTPKGSGGKSFPAVVRWANGPLEDTRVAMPDSDEPTIRAAWKRWRDESGTVMTELSKGVVVAPPRKPTLVVVGREDTDVRPIDSLAMAMRLRADVIEYAGMSHVGPLLGRRAPEVAATVLQWLRARPGE